MSIKLNTNYTHHNADIAEELYKFLENLYEQGNTDLHCIRDLFVINDVAELDTEHKQLYRSIDVYDLDIDTLYLEKNTRTKIEIETHIIDQVLKVTDLFNLMCYFNSLNIYPGLKISIRIPDYLFKTIATAFEIAEIKKENFVICLIDRTQQQNN